MPENLPGSERPAWSASLRTTHADQLVSWTILPEADWCRRRQQHENRVRAWTDPHQARAARGEKHPVYDFLFTYYAFRPAWLRRWHPGPGVALAGDAAREFLRWPEYQRIEGDPNRWRTASNDEQRASAPPFVIGVNPGALPVHRRRFVSWLRDLLRAMQTRPAFFGCYGWHEWAMVYRQTAEEIRHNAYPLRFAGEELARIVQSTVLCCTHFDAFRFFTAPARPLNRWQLARADVGQLEQRGCLHANMDLYKWAFKLAPFTPAELVADCFELARDIREVDMRASPYDLRALGFEPIAIETATGRADYERRQREFVARGEPLRAQLIALCEELLLKAHSD